MIFSEFKHKVILVTGSAQGIGKIVCREFQQYEAIVYQTDIQKTDAPNFLQ